MNDRSRPKAASTSTAKTTSNIVARKAWAYALIRRFDGRPSPYGSQRWVEMADTDPEKVAAALVAAECWATAGDTLSEDLWREVHEQSLAVKHLDDEEFAERAKEHKNRWRHLRVVPAKQGLEARVAAARLPRPGDFRPRQGGGRDAG